MTAVTLHLHGHLKELAPEGVRLDIQSVAEGISALCRRFPSLNPTPGLGRQRIMVRGYACQSELRRPLRADETDIHLVPSFAGEKRGGIAMIVIGAVLVAVAVYNPGGVLQAGTAGAEGFVAGESVMGMGAISASSVFMSGAMMIASGLLAFMSVAPKMDSQTWTSTSNPEASKYLGTPRNTTKAGSRIPILYGRSRIYGQVLSIAIDAKDVSV